MRLIAIKYFNRLTALKEIQTYIEQNLVQPIGPALHNSPTISCGPLGKLIAHPWPIVLKLCSNKAQFISVLILVGMNFIILKILTICFFINSIYLYFYFQYLSTFNIRKSLLILKYNKDQIL